jgi:predicted transcriptional regulator
MDPKIIKHKEDPLSYDEFKPMILETDLAESGLLDKAADSYDKIPSYIRAIQNIDPTGIASTIGQLLSENKAKREQDNIIRAIYNLNLAIQKYSEQLTNLEEKYFSEQVPSLTYKYFELSKRTFESQKIEFFRNIWLNGLINTDKQSGEKASIFELAGILTSDEILALKIFYDEQHVLEFKDRKPTHIEKIAKVLNVEISYAQQISMSLQSRGLLLDYGIGKYGYKGPINFVLTDYAKLFAEYITEPKNT